MLSVWRLFPKLRVKTYVKPYYMGPPTGKGWRGRSNIQVGVQGGRTGWRRPVPNQDPGFGGR